MFSSSFYTQPLDVGVMKPISTYYDTDVTNWLRSNTPKVVTLKDIGEIFGKAFMKAPTMSTAINSFKKKQVFFRLMIIYLKIMILCQLQPQIYLELK